ncbi:phosphatase PAP2 family protein [Furfurilactobacillus entadae]|uniref:phosphatase PAP2 family protein n=1 Tax=Furfurilactobacillus entadae TaxID=2922307 RepID=UPI0035EF7406
MKVRQKQVLGSLLLVCFVGLAVSVSGHMTWLQSMDRSVSHMVAKMVGPFNTMILKGVAVLGSPAVVIGLTALLCVVLWIKRNAVISLWFGAVQLVGAAVADMIKQVIARPRPVHQLVADTGFSFPSGHTFCTTILVLTLLTLVIPLVKGQEARLLIKFAGILWIVLVALSRVYLRDHFFSDVLASVLLATGYWLLITSFEKPLTGVLRRVLPERSRA